ncbi:hypothetical protein PU634_10410 [Oceanimonas pelagia]|uniref:Uncharacterized protein n=1 Tax=Oceanimonas pelagia TaxID=3028314 RepID=A0AA50KLZ0_9GAMM|nr:hypothetical protein [Oceanimonas pelagia]WMC09528.1 hypothetical protein PU634_10410 [Oceanimonas pelagia]
MMNLEMNDYTRVILTQTLCFEQHHALYHPHRREKKFTDYLLEWMMYPDTVVAVYINPADVEVDEETGLAVAKDISWAWKPARVGVQQDSSGSTTFEYLRGAFCGVKPPANLEWYWDYTHVSVGERHYLHGGLINHGTIREPQWGSHS